MKQLRAMAAGAPARGDSQNDREMTVEESLTSGMTGSYARHLLAQLTTLTGGKAYFGRNDVASQLDRSFTEGTSNYTLTYMPSNADFKGEYRKIQIRTTLEGTAARTRLGYYAVDDAAAPSVEMRETRWSAALASAFPYSAFNLSCPLNFDSSSSRAWGVLTISPAESFAQHQPQTQQIIRGAAVSKTASILTQWAWDHDWKTPWTNRVTTAKFDKILPPETRIVRFLISDASAQQIATCDFRVPSK